MSGPRKTVLLSTVNDRLSAYALAHPRALELILIGAKLPDLPLATPYWCFIDWLLPDIAGIELCRRLREHPAMHTAHITMLLPGDDPDARHRSILAGADDYMTGELDIERVFRRLNLDLAEPRITMPKTGLMLGDLQVDTAAYVARYRGTRIRLALNELRLLIHFVKHPNRVYSRNSLIEELGKNGEIIDERTVDVWIGRLRRAFRDNGAPDPLRTVRSVGYVLDHVERELMGTTAKVDAATLTQF